MTPSWLLPDGIITVGIDAQGGATLRLLLARATLVRPAATPSASGLSARLGASTPVSAAQRSRQTRLTRCAVGIVRHR